MTEIRPFSVYIAASAGGDGGPRVTAAIAALRAAGIHVTCTWPEVIAQVGEANPRDATAIERRRWSVQDLNEIDEADVLWFLVPAPPATTRGAWFEAGYAYASHKHLVFSGDTLQSVFCALGHEFRSDSAALAHIVGLRDQAVKAAELAATEPPPLPPAPMPFDLSDTEER